MVPCPNCTCASCAREAVKVVLYETFGVDWATPRTFYTVELGPQLHPELIGAEERRRLELAKWSREAVRIRRILGRTEALPPCPGKGPENRFVGRVASLSSRYRVLAGA